MVAVQATATAALAGMKPTTLAWAEASVQCSCQRRWLGRG